MRRRTYRSADDVLAELDVRVLAGIPEMLTAAELRRRKMQRVTRLIVIALAVLVLGAGASWLLG